MLKIFKKVMVGYLGLILIIIGGTNVKRGRLHAALTDFERANVHGGLREGVTARLHWVRSKLAE